MRGFLIPDGGRLGDLPEFLEKSRDLTRSGWDHWVCLPDQVACSKTKILHYGDV